MAPAPDLVGGTHDDALEWLGGPAGARDGVGWLSSGVIDGIPKTHIKDAYPKLFAIHAAIDGMAKVRAWKKKNPHHYKGK